MMKKFVTLLVALVMVFAMSVTAFAADGGAGTSDDPYLLYGAKEESVTVDAKSEVSYNAFGVSDTVLTITSWDAYVVYNGQTYYANRLGVIEVPVHSDYPMMPVSFVLGNGSEEKLTFDMKFVAVEKPLGSMDNPEVIDVTTGAVNISIEEGNDQGYFMTYQAGYEAGLVSFVVASASEGVEYDVSLLNMSSYKNVTLSEDGKDGVVSVYVEPYDMVQIVVSAAPDRSSEPWVYPALDMEASVTVVGTASNPIWITEDVFEATLKDGSKLYYQGRALAGNTLVVTGENAYVIYNGKAYQATNGVVEVAIAESELGTFAEPVVVQIGNASVWGENEWAEYKVYTVQNVYPKGSLNNPYFVNTPAEMNMTVTMAADEEERYYSLDTKVNGMVLTIKGEEGFSVTVDGVTYTDADENEATDGVVTVVLKQAGRENMKLAFNNYTKEEAVYTVTAEWPAGNINNPVDFSKPADVPTSAVVAVAGQENWYNVSSALAGAILTIDGDNLLVLVNDELVEAVDGVVTVVIPEAQEDTRVLVVNEGTEDAEVAFAIGYPYGHKNNPLPLENPITFPAEIELAAGEETYFSLGNAFNGAILTVKGEGAVIVANGEAVTAVDGVATVTIDVNAMAVVVGVVNSGAEAATYEVELVTAGVESPDTADHASILPIVMMVLAAGVVVLVEKKRHAF